MERLNLTCGDFIDILIAWENLNLKRQNVNSNSKKAGNSTENDVFKTPPGTHQIKGNWTSSANS
jgi:hypothetical protein